MILRPTIVLWHGIVYLVFTSYTVDCAKEKFGLYDINDWLDDRFDFGNGGSWEEKNYILTTDVSIPKAEAWMITQPVKNVSNQIYFDIVAELTKCKVGNSCNLTIFAHNGKDLTYPGDKDERKKYIYNNFSIVRNFISSENVKFKKTFRVSIPSSYITLAIRAKEAAWTIYNLTMYYYYCQETITNNIHLSRTNASINVTANCSENSSSKDKHIASTVNCFWNGTWGGVSNECFCDKGFEPKSYGGCQRCSKNHYKKTDLSNSNCNKCRPSRVNNNDFTECVCPKNQYSSPSGGQCFGLPGKVTDISVKRIDSTTVNITWSKPTGDSRAFISFDIACKFCGFSTDKPQTNHKNCTNCTAIKYTPAQYRISTTYVRISRLKPGKYLFKIYSKLNFSVYAFDGKWQSYEEEYNFKDFGSQVGNKKPTQLFIIVGAVGGGLLLLVLILIILISRTRRRNGSGGKGQDNNGYRGIDLPALGQKVYVDPSNYDDPEAALRDFANEIDPKALRLERVLGGGEFGDVYKGILTVADGTTILVAAKTLKHDSDDKSRKDFFLEASAMGQFSDPNVIKLEGIITKTVPHMILTEYMSNGSLDNFLKQNESKLTDLQMIGMARGVASGMKYLAAINFVHRDLAARNILVNDTLVCKVADFGLSRELETTDSSMGEYCTSGGKIPVRWTAPEAIKYRKFSTASDVWSYGILLWEVMTLGDRPYWDWDNFKVLERVDEGFRLPAPKNCPKRVHDLMLRCWEKERSQRPQFADILTLLNEWIRSPEMIREDREIKRKSLPPGMEESHVTPIKEWLNEIRMSSYMPHFTEAGYEHLQELAGLADADLKNLGVTLIGHRNKMLRTIRTLPITSSQMPSKEAWNRAKSLRV